MRKKSETEKAEGYLELGMFLDGWTALEELPPPERSRPHVFFLRVKILVALGKSDQARVVAEGMAKNFPSWPESWQALALVFLAEGNKKRAKESLHRCFSMSPSMRLAVLDDLAFEDVWQPGF